MTKIFCLLKRLIKTLFFRDSWSIGYRFSKKSLIPYDSEIKFNIIKPSIRWWYADPFCFKHNERYYVFCEMLDSISGTGSIGVIDCSDGSKKKIKQVIKEPFHMSYPNVFIYEDTIYMIPETGRNNQIRLYKAIEFPYKWELDTILMENIQSVDSTILTKEEKQYLFTYDISGDYPNLIVFDFDIRRKILHRTNVEIQDVFNQLRPAGNFIYQRDSIIRPTQFNKNIYGEKLLFNEMLSVSDMEFKESLIFDICASQINVNGKNIFKRIHTINKYDDMEVIDLFESNFCIIKPFFLLAKVILHLLRKSKSYV